MALNHLTGWSFYGRSKELRDVNQILSRGTWFFCSITGRRRIGKTRLIQEALARRPERHFYMQVPDSDERGVVESFQEALEDHRVDVDIAHRFRTFSDMANAIGQLCRAGFIVIIDEFQYFHRDALAPFTSHLQRQVDQLRDTTVGGLFVLGSIHTEMSALLDGRHSPLFNRVTDTIAVGHWDFETLFEMFAAHGISDPRQQLFLWTLFEGVPKFYRDCFDQGVLVAEEDHRPDTLRRLFFEGPSPLKDEAANWFLAELRGSYESLLRLVAKHGPCPLGVLRAEYARAGSGDERKLSAYLAILTQRYEMVAKLQPIFEVQGGRKARYVLRDNFLAAWLKAVGRNVRAARIQPLQAPLDRCSELLMEHEGWTFERAVRQLTVECSRKGVGDFQLTEMVRGYWNKTRVGAGVELDLVAVDGGRQIVRFGSCKRSQTGFRRGGLDKFQAHIDRFLRTKTGQPLRDWRVERALYCTVFEPEMRRELAAKAYVCIDLNDFKGWLSNRREGGGRQRDLFAAVEEPSA